jgi:peptidyl-tRNA hydrolase, PTH1 family
MNLIVCLGNPGKEYEKNRHNIGFRAGDALIQHFSFLKKGKKFKSIFYEGEVGGSKVFLQKPQTYMNNSGEAVALAANFYKILPANILVIYDDFDTLVGETRLKPRGSAGTHNGMKSIISHLGSVDFPRLRIGIGPKPVEIRAHDFVLSNFAKSEENALQLRIQKITEIVENVFCNGLEQTMTVYN